MAAASNSHNLEYRKKLVKETNDIVKYINYAQVYRLDLGSSQLNYHAMFGLYIQTKMEEKKNNVSVVTKSTQSLNLRCKPPSLKFQEKLSQWLKGGLWVLKTKLREIEPCLKLAC